MLSRTHRRAIIAQVAQRPINLSTRRIAPPGTFALQIVNAYTDLMPENNAFLKIIASAPFAFVLFGISAISAGTILIVTSPLTLGPAGMLGAFLVFYVIFFSCMLLGLHAFISFKSRKQRTIDTDDAIDKKQILYLNLRQLSFAATWAFAPLIILALQSIGQLDMVSLLLLVIFECLATFYILKR